MEHLHTWSNYSPLRTSWYNFAVDLVGEAEARDIHTTCFRGENLSCLQRMLVEWYNSTTDHSWQVIIDALSKIYQFSVIDSIEKHCLTLQ